MIQKFEPGTRLPFNLLNSNTFVTYFLPSKIGEVRVDGLDAASPGVDRRHAEICLELLLPYVRQSCEEDPASDDLIASPVGNLGFALERSMEAVRDRSLPLDQVRGALGCARALRAQGLHWVGGRSPETAWLVPPPADAIPEFLSDLNQFLKLQPAVTTEALIVIAYQFIHVHPYADGNGRTMRMLIWLLGRAFEREMEALTILLSVNLRKERTNRHFDEMRLGNPSPWLDALLLAKQALSAIVSEQVPEVERALDDAFDHPHLSRLRGKLERQYILSGCVDSHAIQLACGSDGKLSQRYESSFFAHGWSLHPHSSKPSWVWPSLETSRRAVAVEFLGWVDAQQS